MSASKFAIFCIVLICLASLHECANLEKKPKGTCSKTPKQFHYTLPKHQSGL
ncbi:unnamed protein product [Brassica rapa]|uniref:Uncharacterized protein n=1 Tax=Brassica campestris TaxID=3711 RepID=A0A8D9CS58_BRACM|nr:unnamed protein product [Brassica rapa]